MDGYGYMGAPKKKSVWAAPKIFFAKILNEPREGR
jgi:hypothetical protein